MSLSAKRLAGFGALAAVLIVGAVLWRVSPTPAAPPPENFVRETLVLMSQKKYPAARERLRGALVEAPQHPVLHNLMGECLMAMSAYESAVPHFEAALEGDREEPRIQLGAAHQIMGRSARALPYLEKPALDENLERLRLGSLAECYLDLERYEESLKLLDALGNDLKYVRARHRALCYAGRADEAQKLLEKLDAQATVPLRAMRAREEGDFAAALELLRGSGGSRFRRSELSVLLESGDLARLESASFAASEPMDRGVALWHRAMALLLQGRRDEAKAAAKEFLAAGDREYTPLRLERLMMRHLIGEVRDAEIEGEAREVARFFANDLYFYLAAATGDRAWAEKALQSTPGHNFPYHAIRRFLQK